MISLKTLILELLVIKVALSACPTGVDLGPCICYEKNPPQFPDSIVRCGDSTKDFTAASLKTALNKVDGDFDILYIHDGTIIDTISNETVKATFKQIFIEKNKALANIEVNAFKENVLPEVLVIRENPAFVGKDIFTIAKAHGKNLTDLNLRSNAIGDIPNDALKGADNSLQNLKYIRLDKQTGNPKMIKIGTDAFSKLPNLLQLSLDYNAIAQIGDASKAGIDLAVVKSHVSVFLNNNALPSTELVGTKIIIPNAGSVGLVLENNSVKIDLKASKVLFAAIASKADGKVFLYNKNSTLEPICNCADIPEITGANVKTHIIGVDKCTKASNTPVVPLNQCVSELF